MISTRNRIPRAPLSAALLALIVLAARSASANPYELFGFTPRAIGLSDAVVAVPDDLSAIFYNPAAMVGHTKTEFGLGFEDTLSNLYINRAPGTASQPASTIDSSMPDNVPRIEFGLIFPLGGAVLKDRVAIGFTFGTPLGSLIKVQTVDQSKPQFYMYQSKPQRFAAALSAGIKIVDGLSIGIGAQVIAEQIASVDFAIDLAARRFDARNIDVALNTEIKPFVGILVQPNDWISIGFSWRDESELYYTQPTTLDLGDIGKLVLNVAGYAQYWPHVFSLGTSLKPTSRLLLSFQLDYLLWSSAPNDQVYVQISPSGPVLDGLGLSSILGFSSNDAPMGFQNIFIPRVGIEYVATDWLAVRGGAYVRPAITPDQTGTTNYLDNFTENFSAGATLKFEDPLHIFTEAVHLDLSMALMVANERDTVKSQAIDATGNYSYGGTLFSFGAMLRYLY